MARRKSTNESASESPSFEDALGSLESIVEAMENEQLPLEELVAHYEKGSKLLNQCEALLQDARGRIELITLRNQEEIALAADSNSDTVPPISTMSEDSDDSDDDDDIRLF